MKQIDCPESLNQLIRNYIRSNKKLNRGLKIQIMTMIENCKLNCELIRIVLVNLLSLIQMCPHTMLNYVILIIL